MTVNRYFYVVDLESVDYPVSYGDDNTSESDRIIHFIESAIKDECLARSVRVRPLTRLLPSLEGGDTQELHEWMAKEGMVGILEPIYKEADKLVDYNVDDIFPVTPSQTRHLTGTIHRVDTEPPAS